MQVQHFTVNRKICEIVSMVLLIQKSFHAYFKYHIGSASLVTFSFAFMIFFIYRGKKIQWNHVPFVSTKSHSLPTKTAYLYIDEVVEWVYVLLHKSFHLENICIQ